MRMIFCMIGVVFGLVVVFMLLTVGVATATNLPKGGLEEVLPGVAGAEGNPKKAFILYQPALTKITTKVAQQLADGLEAGGYEVTLHRLGKHLTTDLSQYQLVVFGGPTYAGKLAKALTKYMAEVCPQLAKVGAAGPRVVLFATGGLNGTPEFDRLNGILAGVNVVRKEKILIGPEAEKKAYDLGTELAQE